jgi:Tfp pilus assembly protein FimV
MDISENEINAMLQEIQRQRNQAQDELVMCAKQMAILQSDLAEKQKEVDHLKEKAEAKNK